MPFLMRKTHDYAVKATGALIALAIFAVSAAVAQTQDRAFAPTASNKKILHGNPPSSSWLPQLDA